MPAPKSVLALDVGGRRVGVALASLAARLPSPLTTLQQGDGLFAELQKIIEDEAVGVLVVGLPRGLEGQETGQTTAAKGFADELKARFGLPVYLQDEALTSKKAEAELAAAGKGYVKDQIDALAATYILEDWLVENKE